MNANTSQKVVIDGRVIKPGIYATFVDYANGGKVTFIPVGPPQPRKQQAKP